MIVRNRKPEVLLSFDDGPTKYLPEILSVLRDEDVQGLFFWQSSLVEENVPWRRLLGEGHMLGGHADTHVMLPELSYEDQLGEIVTSKKRLEQLTGETLTRFRPPYGLYNDETMEIANGFGLDVVLWSVASWDWKHETNEAQIIENIRAHAKPGDIVLLHELPQTVDVLPELIRVLREKGLRFPRPHAQPVLTPGF